MKAEDRDKARHRASDAAPLIEALNRSAQVHDTVEQLAAELSSVNAVLKGEIAVGHTPPKVELALQESEAVEAKAQEAAEQLCAVHDVLVGELEARHNMERQLSEIDAALSECQAREEHARHEAHHDRLTGLANVALFDERLAGAIAYAHRHRRRLGVMFLDIDAFKALNDTHGHAIGDAVLQRVAQQLKASVRSSDTVSRRGGDEFVLLILDPGDEARITALGTRITDAIAQSWTIRTVPIAVSVSLGIALYPDQGRTAEALLKHADMAMYAAKQRNRASLADSGR